MYDPLTRPSVRHHVDKFFNTISDSTIYKIKIPTDIIYGLLEQDPIITFSNYINFAQNNNFKDLNSDIRKYNIEGWNNQDNYSHSLQKLCTILWLLKDINSSKEVATPFQFIKTKKGYFLIECNPRLQGTSMASMAFNLNIPIELVKLSSTGDCHRFQSEANRKFSRYYKEIFYDKK